MREEGLAPTVFTASTISRKLDPRFKEKHRYGRLLDLYICILDHSSIPTAKGVGLAHLVSSRDTDGD